jgi:antitoxin VapB
MSLNIKNERVHALAREAARRTGKTQTSVIEEALTRLLADLEAPEADERLGQVDLVLARVDAVMTDEIRAAVRRDLDEMYDDSGLPR